jgi:hypothetical protein
MLKFNLTYSLLLLTVLGLSGCSEKTIMLPSSSSTSRSVPIEQPRIIAPTPIKEEILINKNADLGAMIAVPSNNASLGSLIDTEENISTEEGIEKKDVPVFNGLIERMPFPVSEYNALSKIGSQTVTGLVYLENNIDDQKVMGKKVKLYLNPVTSYSDQWYQQSYLGGYKMSKADGRLYNYLKFTMSNESGKYSFFGVPTGEYYLVGTMTCGNECGFSKQKTVVLVQKIYVGSGVTTANLMKNVP